MKINFDCILKNEKHEIIKDVNSTHLIGLALLSYQFKEGDLVKKYNLQTQITQNKEIDVDDSDFALIRKAVAFPESSLAPVVAAQILIHMDNEKLKQSK
jgi:hypothetical protein